MSAPQDAIPAHAPHALRWLDDRAQRHPELTQGLLNALDRPAANCITPSIGGTVVAGLLTAGAFPAVSLARKWTSTIRWHQNILWHLAEWMKVNLGSAEGIRLHAVSQAPLPGLIGRLAAAVGIAAVLIAGVGIASGVPLSSFWFAEPWAGGEPVAIAFIVGLAGSFTLLWISINLHLRRLHHAREVLDEITPHLPPTAGLRVAGWEWGLRPVPLVLGGLLALSGMLWGLPMVIAATAQRRALCIHHRRLRAQLAHRVRDLLEVRRPLVTLPAVIDRTGICRNAVCDQPVAPDGRFCPRCGTPQRPISQILE